MGAWVIREQRVRGISPGDEDRGHARADGVERPRAISIASFELGMRAPGIEVTRLEDRDALPVLDIRDERRCSGQFRRASRITRRCRPSMEAMEESQLAEPAVRFRSISASSSTSAAATSSRAARVSIA